MKFNINEIHDPRTSFILTEDGVEIVNNIFTALNPFKSLQSYTNLSLNAIADILSIPRSTFKINVKKNTDKYLPILYLKIDYFIFKYVSKYLIKDGVRKMYEEQYGKSMDS